MSKLSLGKLSILGALLLLGFLSFEYTRPPPSTLQNTEALAFGSVGGEKIARLFNQWTSDHQANGGDHNITLGLAYRKGLSKEFTYANGKADLNLVTGTVNAEVFGLDTESDWRMWLIDQRGIEGDADRDIVLDLGLLASSDDNLVLQSQLDPQTFSAFQVDLIAISREGDPAREGLLYGAPTLFQSLYTAMQSETLLAASEFAQLEGVSIQSQAEYKLGITTANAATTNVDPDVLFDNLVAVGADLFINETFKGNGRTCATCHGTKDNFALSVSDIGSRRDDDPLFVAEFMPNLAFTEAGPKFEVPALMRGNALILTNDDGTDDLANNFNMRGVPHTLALQTSIQSSFIPTFGTPGFAQNTGWGGDGSPNDGVLHDGVGRNGSLLFFAAGAVIQHLTKTLNRVPGVDFRQPSLFELQALEAFQLSLGRDSEITLPLNLTNPIVARGQELFNLGGPNNPSCFGCHLNGGATVSAPIPDPGANFNFNIGAEDQQDRPIDIILAAEDLDLTPDYNGRYSRDRGFGRKDNPGNIFNDVANGFGNGRFATTTVIESADTGPFFHDNSVSTIEAAVAFYDTDEFNNSADAALVGGIRLTATQIQAISSFLRVLNSLENLRSSLELSQAAADGHISYNVSKELLLQSLAELEDAERVLIGADLHPDAVAEIRTAVAFSKLAAGTRLEFLRIFLIAKSINAQESAKAAMVSST
jgi:cytochrome c peroxidase